MKKQKVNLRTWRTKSGKKRQIALYTVWYSMIKRCGWEGHKHYHRYGGRGISVCEEWHRFMSFREWALGAGYRKGLTIDRVDNDSGYSPDNCHWVTQYEQTQNRDDRKGSDHGRSKLKEDDVLFIRSSHLRHWELANRFGVHRSTVTAIKNRRIWRHL